ncbi:MAG: GNAT family N-acetyltransferase [Gemmatimonadota bacterium]
MAEIEAGWGVDVDSGGEVEPTSGVAVRPAVPEDVRRVGDLLAVFVRLKLVRPRPLVELRRELGNFLVAELDGKVVGCVSLRIYSPALAEVASLAVQEGHHGLGIGRRLVHAAVLRAHSRGVHRVFAFTMRESLFLQLGFRAVPVTDFPQKLVTDYGGLALAAGRKAAVVLDLEAAQSGAPAVRLPPNAAADPSTSAEKNSFRWRRSSTTYRRRGAR